MKLGDLELILDIIRLMCPLLVDIADRTDNPIDNVVVGFVCDVVRNEDQAAPEK